MKFLMKCTKAPQPIVKSKQVLTSKEVDKTKPQREKKYLKKIVIQEPVFKRPKIGITNQL